MLAKSMGNYKANATPVRLPTSDAFSIAHHAFSSCLAFVISPVTSSRPHQMTLVGVTALHITSWWERLVVVRGSMGCTTYNPSGLPTTLSTTGINISSWAFDIPTGTAWNPAEASSAAIPNGFTLQPQHVGLHTHTTMTPTPTPAKAPPSAGCSRQ
ncbi:hypothetical protein M408DRAFT_29984 [Serendipita vermifera MAFF 305830]|uniref:Uncharacterized protein n=1 Tax=Serendipita vermifera MAFF 305830 TaxID=933852 RepID=A0A0C2WTX6_SERVB|nr:hypothetical protein M408DRAFT_29984 [Serendipita vermifera MAFF 305830]